MKKIISLIMLMLGVSIAYCDNIELTWQDCISMANTTNQTLVMAKQDLQIAQYEYNVILNKYYPSVNFKYGFSRSGKEENTENNWSASLNASQQLYSFADTAQIKGKKATINKTVAQLTKTAADVYCSIKESFLDVCYAQENIELLESIYKLRKQSADIVRLQYEGGKESKGNMLKAQAQKQNAYVNVSNAKRDLIVAKRKLAQALGTEVSSDFTIKYKLSEIEDKRVINVDDMVWNCPDVILSSSSVEIAKYSLNTSKGSLYPTISATGSVGVSDHENPIPPADNNNWSLGVALNYPLFSNGITGNINSIKSSQTAFDKANENHKKVVLETKASLEESLSTIEQTRDNIGIYKMFLEAAIQRQKEATVKYRAGTMEFQIWQDIEQEYVNYQLSYLMALENYNIALAKRDKLLGNTNGEIK